MQKQNSLSTTHSRDAETQPEEQTMDDALIVYLPTPEKIYASIWLTHNSVSFLGHWLSEPQYGHHFVNTLLGGLPMTTYIRKLTAIPFEASPIRREMLVGSE